MIIIGVRQGDDKSLWQFPLKTDAPMQIFAKLHRGYSLDGMHYADISAVFLQNQKWKRSVVHHWALKFLEGLPLRHPFCTFHYIFKSCVNFRKCPGKPCQIGQSKAIQGGKNKWLKYYSCATALFESFAKKPVKSRSGRHRRLENNPKITHGIFVQILHINIDDVWDATW